MFRLTLSGNFLLKRLLVALALLTVLAACSSRNQQPPVSLTTLPPGDASRGATLFTQSINGAPSCSTCHRTDDTTLVGPGMEGYGARAATQVSGKNAEDYTLESITRPAAYFVPGFPNAMYNNYSANLTPQDLADLAAYLLTL